MSASTGRAADRGALTVATMVGAVAVWLALATVLPFPTGQAVVVGLSVLVPVGTGLLCAAWAPEDTAGSGAGTDTVRSRPNIRDHDHEHEG